MTGEGNSPSVRLSKRLSAILSMVPCCRSAADIGCDHGLLSIALLKEGRAESVIASDLRPGPLARAEENIRAAGLSEKISLRLSDGLSSLSPGEADVIIIAGMGGLLILRILEEGKDVLKSVKTLVLSPHTDIEEVRRRLPALGFKIRKEKIIKDAGKYYFTLRAEQLEKEAEDLEENTAPGKSADETEEQQLYYAFGCLIDTCDPVFWEYLQKEEKKTEDVLLKVKNASDTAYSENLARLSLIRAAKARMDKSLHSL